MIRDCLEPEKHLMFPKNPRIKNKKVLNEIRAIGYCELCRDHRSLETHHWKSKGSGGNDTRDNLICLCHNCHMKVHGGRIDRDIIRDVIARREDDAKF